MTLPDGSVVYWDAKTSVWENFCYELRGSINGGSWAHKYPAGTQLFEATFYRGLPRIFLIDLDRVKRDGALEAR